eukprot:GSChrysophyteH1.ASY1.ANO1.1786.1 assembled CDS
MEDFMGLWTDVESVHTATSDEQLDTEQECSMFLRPFSSYNSKTLKRLRDECKIVSEHGEVCLMKEYHTAFLMSGLQGLRGGFVALDASKPWILYWILHALHLLRADPFELSSRIVQTLTHMQHTGRHVVGGFGGGPGQIAHSIYRFFLAMKTASQYPIFDIQYPIFNIQYSIFNTQYSIFNIQYSIFNIRSCELALVDACTYTVLAISRILNILTPELISGTAEYLLQCQTYEGGFGGEPGNEAHGGYNFCALAGLVILNRTGDANMKAQKKWLQMRQTRLEGGFMGRTNKLVDSCYSFWQGAALAMCEMVGCGDVEGNESGDCVYIGSHGGDDISDLLKWNITQQRQESTNMRECTADDFDMELNVEKDSPTSGPLPFNQLSLQRYILYCAQNIEGGGMRDKPGKSPDFYHTCYSLSGLSISQNFSRAYVLGDETNQLEPTSAVFNIGLSRLKCALKYFYKEGMVHEHEDLLQ